MKNYILVALTCSLTLLQAQQNVGIGTPTPNQNAILDLTASNKGLLLPRVADTNAVTGVKPNGLIIYSNANGKLYLYSGTAWVPVETSQLEKISNGSSYGWRLFGSNPVNYGPIGNRAVDLSTSDLTTPNGAVGLYSLAANYNTVASGNFTTALGWNTQATSPNSIAMGAYSRATGITSTAMGVETLASGRRSTSIGDNTIANSYTSVALGRYNDTIVGSSGNSWVDTDPLLMVGNGTSSSRRNAMTVYKNGTFDLQNHTVLPSNTNNKFYLFNNEPYFGSRSLHSQLEKISVGSNSGWRLYGSDPTYFGPIGNGAVDLSVSSNTVMNNTGASGNGSIAIGVDAKASGEFSTAIGTKNTAGGKYATALGLSTFASSYASTTIGTYNDTIAGSSRNSWILADPLFIIGNGVSTPSNAMTVYKNGNTDISGFTRLGHVLEGAPRIKQKLVNLNSASSDGGINSVKHFLNYNDIISVTAVLDYSISPTSGTVTPGYRYAAGYEFSLSYDITDIYISNQAGNSANILNKPVKVLITYTE